MRKLALLALALAPVASLANGYDVPDVSARDLSMVGSLVAAQRDAGATYRNPAALSKIEGLSLALTGAFLDIENTWTSPDRTESRSMLFRPAPPVALFASYGGKFLDRGWGAGFGMTIPAGGNVFWPNGWQGRYAIQSVDRKVYGFYLSGGVEVLPWLRLGGGAVYYRTTEKLKQAAAQLLTRDVYAELGTAGGALSFDLSAEIAVPSLPITIGVDYKHQGVQKLEGSAHFIDPPPELAQAMADQDVKHTLTYPNALHVGVAWKVVDPLLVTGEWTWNRYSVYQQDLFVGSLGTTITVPRDYGNGYTFRVGAEWKATDRLELRAGVLRDHSGQKTDFYSPSLPDGDTWAFGLGGGWSFSRDLSVALGLFYAPFDKVTTTGTEAFQGSYTPSAFIASVGVSWKPM
jgi:long-chain fatty acid transport protein